MQLNKILAIIFLICVGLGLLGLVFDTPTTADVASGLYTLAGLGFYIFGSWLSVKILIESK